MQQTPPPIMDPLLRLGVPITIQGLITFLKNVKRSFCLVVNLQLRDISTGGRKQGVPTLFSY